MLNAFTRNYADNSTEAGFQFTFYWKNDIKYLLVCNKSITDTDAISFDKNEYYNEKYEYSLGAYRIHYFDYDFLIGNDESISNIFLPDLAMEYNINMFEDCNIKLFYGKYPENDNEVLISKTLYYNYKMFNYNGSFVKEESDIINKKIEFDGKNMTIVGIIDDDYEYEDYINDFSNKKNNSKNDFDEFVFLNSGYFSRNKIKEFMEFDGTLYINNNILSDNSIFKCSYDISIIEFIDEAKETLVGNECILSAHRLKKDYGFDYIEKVNFLVDQLIEDYASQTYILYSFETKEEYINYIKENSKNIYDRTYNYKYFNELAKKEAIKEFKKNNVIEVSKNNKRIKLDLIGVDIGGYSNFNYLSEEAIDTIMKTMSEYGYNSLLIAHGDNYFELREDIKEDNLIINNNLRVEISKYVTKLKTFEKIVKIATICLFYHLFYTTVNLFITLHPFLIR